MNTRANHVVEISDGRIAQEIFKWNFWIPSGILSIETAQGQRLFFSIIFLDRLKALYTNRVSISEQLKQ